MFGFVSLFAVANWALPAFAQDSSPPIGAGKFHVTADRTLYHSNVKVHEAFGHVVMNADDQRLSADYAWIDTKTGDVRVRGNVVFVSAAWTIQSAEMHFNMNTGHGSIFYGTVSNENYRLRGQLIRKVGDARFLTTEGEYTTCRDCAESWKISAKNVDMTVDGYAFLEDAYVHVKAVPVLYMPYLIVPVKTRRQTGLLFPRVGTGSKDGFRFVQPLFIAIDDHQDATLGYGRYSKRGQRGEVEYRYKSYEGIQGFLRGFYIEDRDFALGPDRFAGYSEHDVPFSRHFDLKLRVNETKDRDYARTFPEDIPGEHLPALESNLTLTSTYDDFFIAAEGKRYRSTIGRDIGRFDKNVVQVGPSVYFGLRERKILGLTGNVYAQFDRFYRESGQFYDANGNGIFDSFSNDRIREAQRLQIAPELTYSVRLGNAFVFQPSVQYNERVHFFDLDRTNATVGNLSSRYVRGRAQLLTSLDRVYYAPADSKAEAYKHQITPILGYSNIPWFQETKGHPFNYQALQPGGIFDQFDTIPMRNRLDYLREPVGNAVNVAIYSRLVRKSRTAEKNSWVYPYDFVVPKEKEYPKPYNKKQEVLYEKNRLWDEFGPDYRAYKTIWLATVEQSYDIRESKRVLLSGDRPRAPFSPLLFRSILSLDDLSNYVEYQYKPYGRYLQSENRYKSQHDLRVTGEWTLKSLVNSRGTLFFKRSIKAGFNIVTAPNPSRSVEAGFTWSFNDYFTVGYYNSYDILNKKRIEETISSIYNSPSECWQLKLNYTQKPIGTDFSIDLALNLMGSGYVGFGQAPGSGATSAGFGGI